MSRVHRVLRPVLESKDQMIIGYARVSTEEQKLDLQIQALENLGCERIFTDHGQSGFRFARNGLEDALRNLGPGGTLVVWRLDRLGRSLSGLVGLMEQLGERDIHFRSVRETEDVFRPMLAPRYSLPSMDFERRDGRQRTTGSRPGNIAEGMRRRRAALLLHRPVPLRGPSRCDTSARRYRAAGSR